MATKAFALKQQIIAAVPSDQLPWQFFGRILIKTGVSLARVTEDNELSREDLQKVQQAAQEIFGKAFTI